jgi:hypothetical protein
MNDQFNANQGLLRLCEMERRRRRAGAVTFSRNSDENVSGSADILKKSNELLPTPATN